MKKVVVLLFSLGLFFPGSTSVKGCSCSIVSLFNKSIREQVLEAHREAKAVFVGKVVTVESPPNAHYRMVTLEIQSGWKGPSTDRLVIMTGQGGGDCGYAFEVGETYLVYAYQYNKSYLGTNICQRTKPVGGASSDLEYLGKPRFKRTAEQGETVGSGVKTVCGKRKTKTKQNQNGVIYEVSP